MVSIKACKWLHIDPSNLVSYAKVIVILLGCTIFLPILLTLHGCEAFDFRNTGQIGDTIGGTMGPFIAIGAAILTFFAFWAQIEANNQQSRDISVERFESNLFQMISLHEDITNSLRYTYLRWNNDEKCLSEGRAVFDYIYNIRKFDWHSGLKQSIEEYGYEIMNLDSSLGCLDHYFSHLYRILKYIEDAKVFENDKSKRYEYTSIVRSMLSEFELILLFYNAISNNSDFKKIIETYALLQYIRVDNLALEVERTYYKNLICGKTEQSSDSNMDICYSIGAFKYVSEKA